MAAADGGAQGNDNERFREATVIAKLPDVFGRNDPIPSDLIGARIIQFGTFQDSSLAEGGGLVIDYRPKNSSESRRVVFAFSEEGMWAVTNFSGLA
jgi:hypothetical protein